jgi:adenylylsulfate kinase
MTAELTPPRAPVFWFTGLPGAGKTTLAQAFARRLLAQGQSVLLLDGDVIRRGLSADLGFSPEARRENIRRVAEVAKLLSDSGTVALAALITPLASDRQLAEAIVGEAFFVEVFVDAPLATCEARDPKGMYREARAGSRASFTGLSAPYERPVQPRLALPSSELSVAACVDALEQVFKAFGPAAQ